MLLNPSDRTESRAARVWAAVAAGGLLAAGAAASGVGVAQADEPKVVAVRVAADDDQDEKKVETTEKKVETVKGTFRLVGGADAELIAKLEKAVAAAALKGDEKEVKAAVAKLKAALAPKAVEGHRVVLAAGEPKVVRLEGEPKVTVVRPAAGQPLVTRVQVSGGDVKPVLTYRVATRTEDDPDVAKLEKAIEKLKATAEELKDQPEAKAAIEKSIAEYKKKIAEAKRKGELKRAADPAAPPAAAAKPVPPVPPVAPVPAAPKAAQGQAEALNKLMQFRQGSLDRLSQQLAGNMDEVLKQYEKQLAGLADNPDAQAKLKDAMGLYKKAMEDALAQLKANPAPMLWQAVPPGPGQFQPFPGGAMNLAPAAKAGYAPGKLGVQLTPVPDAVVDQFDFLKDKGLLVSEVFDGSPAARAGIKAKDILLSIAGQDVSLDVNAVTKQVAAAGYDKPIDVVVLRAGKQQTIKGVTLQRPAEAKPAAPAQAAKKATATKEAKKADGPSFKSMAVSVNNEKFVIKAEGDGTTYKIDGVIEGGKPVAKNIAIDQEGKGYTGGTDNLPAKYQPAVDKLLKSVGGN